MLSATVIEGPVFFRGTIFCIDPFGLVAARPRGDGALSVGHFEQARPYSVPIALARRGHFEPFTGVLRLLSGLAPLGEGACSGSS